MYVHCMYGLGWHPVPKLNIQITFGLGSDRFSPKYVKSCVYSFGSHSWMNMVCTGPYVQCTYGSVHTMYLQVSTYIVRKQTR